MPKVKNYDVHFLLSGFYIVEATSKKEAKRKTNEIIQDRIEEIEDILHTGIEDTEKNYVTDVVSY